MIGQRCNIMCADFGFCKSANPGTTCEGFEHVVDPEETDEKLERTTY